MSDTTVWALLKPWFNSVFMRDLGVLHSTMKGIQTRICNDVKYTPNREMLNVIAKRILDGRRDLYNHNIDFGIKQFVAVGDSISFLLLLLKARAEMFPKRTKITTANSDVASNPQTYFAKFRLLIESHAELMLKLKTDGKVGSDFFGKRYKDVDNNLRMLKNIMYRGYRGRPLTNEQHIPIINIFDDYKRILQLVFMVSEENQLLYDVKVDRPKLDVRMAALEIYYIFTDSVLLDRWKNIPTDPKSIGKKPVVKTFGKNRIKRDNDIRTACECINIIIGNIGSYQYRFPEVFRKSIPNDSLEKYLSEFFALDDVAKSKRIKEAVDIEPTRKLITEYFFEIINKYI